MAQEIVDLVAKRLKEEYKLSFKESNTKHATISGGDVGGSTNFEHFIEKSLKPELYSYLPEDEQRFLIKNMVQM